MEMNYICLIMNECDHIVEVEAILSRESRVKRLLREVLSSPGADRTLGKNSLTLSIYIVLKRFRSIEDDACIDCERFLQSYKSTQSIAENIVEELEKIVEQYLCGVDVVEIFAPICTRKIFLKCGVHGKKYSVHCPSSFGFGEDMMMHMVHAMTNQGIRRLRAIEKDGADTSRKSKLEMRQVRRNRTEANAPYNMEYGSSLKSAMRRVEAMELVKEALQNPCTFNSIGSILRVDPGLDFGVHCVGKREPLGEPSTLLECQELLHLRGKEAIHKGSLRISFQSKGELWLCAAVAAPRCACMYILQLKEIMPDDNHISMAAAGSRRRSCILIKRTCFSLKSLIQCYCRDPSPIASMSPCPQRTLQVGRLDIWSRALSSSLHTL